MATDSIPRPDDLCEVCEGFGQLRTGGYGEGTPQDWERCFGCGGTGYELPEEPAALRDYPDDWDDYDDGWPPEPVRPPGQRQHDRHLRDWIRAPSCRAATDVIVRMAGGW